MKIYAARKIGYDAEGLRRAVEYLCQYVCDDMGLVGYNIDKYKVGKLHRDGVYVFCVVDFEGAKSHGWGGQAYIYLDAPTDQQIPEDYFVRDTNSVLEIEQKLTPDSDMDRYQAKYDHDFEIFCSAIDDTLNGSGLSVECIRSPEVLNSNSLIGTFYARLIAVDGPYAPYRVDYHHVNSEAYPEVPASTQLIVRNYWYWDPVASESAVNEAAASVATGLISCIDEMNDRISKYDDYLNICNQIVDTLTAAIPGLDVTHRTRWAGESIPAAYFDISYNGTALNNTLDIPDVFHVDMNKLVKNMKRRLQRVDQRRAEKESTGFTYL